MAMASLLKRKLIAWILRWTGSCEKAAALISQSLDRRLSTQERAMLAVHIWICSHCKRYREQLIMIQKIAKTIDPKMTSPTEPGSSISLTPEARERIKKALREFEDGDSDFMGRNAG